MGKYIIQPDQISWKYGFFKKKKGSLKTEKIIAILPYRKSIFTHKVKILSGESRITDTDIKMSKKNVEEMIKMLKQNGSCTLYSDRLKMIISSNDSLAKDIQDGKYHKVKGKDNILFCYDDFSIVANGFTDNSSSVKHDEVIFFKNYKSGGKQMVYYGSNSSGQVEFKIPTKEQLESFKNYLLSKNEIINFEAGGDFKEYGHSFSIADIVHPERWRTKERLILREGGLLFEQKKGKKVDTIYLPYDEINSHSMKNNILTGSLVIYGKQNVIAKRRFSKKVIKQLKNEFKNVQMEKIKGATCKRYYCWLGLIPIWPRNSFGVITYNGEGINIKPSKDFKKRHKGENVKLQLKYDEIRISVEKYRFLSPRRNLYIDYGSGNIRQDQSNKSHDFKFKGFNKTKRLLKAYQLYMFLH